LAKKLAKKDSIKKYLQKPFKNIHLEVQKFTPSNKKYSSM
jgi:hypothetical protein